MNITERIKKTLLKERLIFITSALMGFFSFIITVIILLSLLANVYIIPVPLKIALLIISGAGGMYFIWKYLISRLYSGSETSVAIKLEKQYPELKGRLIAALQFSQSGDAKQIGFSDSLIGATLIQAERLSSPMDFNRILSFYSIWKSLKKFALSGAAAILLLILFPGLFAHAYKVYSNPTELIAPPLGYRLANIPGEFTAIKYRDVDIGAALVGNNLPGEAEIYYKYAGGIWQKNKIDLTAYKSLPTAAGDSLIFYTTLKQVRRSLEYYVSAGRLSTSIAHIEVVDRPRVTGIKLSLFYPLYTGLAPAIIDENDGNISAVVGTRVNLKIETNTPVKTAEMVFSDSSCIPFEINGQAAELSLRVDEDRTYYIHLADYQGETNPDPISYSITAIPDEFPVATVIRPGVDINLDDDMMIPLLIRISDDYGFSSLVLKYNIISEGQAGPENVAVLHFSDRIKTQGEVPFNWDVEPLALMPSEYIRYYFELADNDNITGPKIARSRQYIARLPSLEEIIAETESDYGENIDQTEQYLKTQRELSERLKNMARKMDQEQNGSDQKLPWQHQKELEEIVRRDEQLAEQVKQTAESLDKLIDKMQENRVASRELLEKLAEIQKLFSEVATPEMKEARLKMLEALKNMDLQQLNQAMKDYQMSQEDMMRRLDRTLTLLRKMQIEQKVGAMTEIARELVDRQEKVNEQSTAAAKENLPELTPAEKKVGDGLENLKNEVAKLRDLLKETAFQKQEEADKFCEAVEGSDAGQNIDSMAQNLDNRQKEAALDQGQKSLSKLRSLLDQLQQGQTSMCQGGGGEASKLMRDAIEDINYVSDKQEKIIHEALNMRAQSEVLRDLAADQELLREITRTLSARIEAIGKESPFVAAELDILMRSAIENMNLSVDQLSEKQGNAASNFQRESLFKLNRAAVRMLDALESQSNCNKGGSCSKPSQKLQMLCDKQNELNKQTQSQCNKPGGQSGQPGETMRRLAAEQGSIHKSLQQLQDEFGSSREVLGRLEAIGEDMKKVADVLDNGAVGEETLNRQLKIYSRMLDAVKTMQRKDFTEQRKATVGQDVVRVAPLPLSGNQGQGELDIEDRLRQFLDESYPEEYEQHIKAYFKALLEQLETKNLLENDGQ